MKNPDEMTTDELCTEIMTWERSALGVMASARAGRT